MGGEFFLLLIAVGVVAGAFAALFVLIVSHARYPKRALLALAAFFIELVVPLVVFAGFGMYSKATSPPTA